MANLTSEQWFFLEPRDVLAFRDARPFGAGEQHLLRGVFPPYPTTVVGALRAALIATRCRGGNRGSGGEEACPSCRSTSCEAWREAGGAGEDPPFQTELVLPARRVEPGVVDLLWPAPRHLMRHRDDHDRVQHPGKATRVLELGRPLAPDRGATDLKDGLRPVGIASRERFEPVGGFLRTSHLETVLCGHAPDSIAPVEVLDRELRTGIGMGPSRTTEQGMLYLLDAVRLRSEIGIAVRVRGTCPIPSGTLIRLGGEGRLAEVTELRAPVLPSRPPLGDRCILYSAAPAILERGHLPDDIPGYRVVGAAVGRAERIGGWDAARSRPRPLRACAPGGSVWFLERTGQEPVTLPTVLGARSSVGFGFSLWGVWT